MVLQRTELGSSAPIAACLAGAWPNPAPRTFPITTSSISDASTLLSIKAAPIAVDPNSGALTVERLPRRLPMGVLFAETIATSILESNVFIIFVF